MKNIFFDMDGVLAEWIENESFETVCSPGYFKALRPQKNVLEAVKLLSRYNDVNVCILSAVFKDDHSLQEKNEWLNYYLPEIDASHRFFVYCGESKWLQEMNEKDVLVDDYSENLHDWAKNGGCGIKLLNGINWTNKSWKGFCVNMDCEPKIIAASIHAFAFEELG